MTPKSVILETFFNGGINALKNLRKSSKLDGFFIINTVLKRNQTLTGPYDGPPQIAWKALKIFIVFTTAFKREGTCPMEVKLNIA